MKNETVVAFINLTKLTIYTIIKLIMLFFYLVTTVNYVKLLMF